MELQGEHPRQWWLFNEVSSPKQPTGREGKQLIPMPAPKAAGSVQLERRL